VRCTLIPSTGATINLGTFTLRNGRADWATPTTVDPHTLSRAQLTIEYGQALARATFVPAQETRDPDHDKNRGKTKDNVKQELKDDSRADEKDDRGKERPGNTTGSTKDTDQDSGDHKDRGGHPHNAEHAPATTQSNNGHQRDGSSGTSNKLINHLADHPPVGSHPDTNRQDLVRRGHPRTGTDDHNGDHQHHRADHHGSVTVNPPQ
jgi:hypothetical protein